MFENLYIMSNELAQEKLFDGLIASMMFLSNYKFLSSFAQYSLKFCVSFPQKHPFILMYEERFVDVASYVCRILDQIPASPISPMYVD